MPGESTLFASSESVIVIRADTRYSSREIGEIFVHVFLKLVPKNPPPIKPFLFLLLASIVSLHSPPLKTPVRMSQTLVQRHMWNKNTSTPLSFIFVWYLNSHLTQVCLTSIYLNYMQIVTKSQFDVKIKISYKYIRIHEKLSCDECYILHTIQC